MNYFVHNTALSKAPSFCFQSENPAQELAAPIWTVRAEKGAESAVGAGSWWEEALRWARNSTTSQPDTCVLARQTDVGSRLAQGGPRTSHFSRLSEWRKTTHNGDIINTRCN